MKEAKIYLNQLLALPKCEKGESCDECYHAKLDIFLAYAQAVREETLQTLRKVIGYYNKTENQSDIVKYGWNEVCDSVKLTDYDEDYMCPNCVTPWKCNGPHLMRNRSELKK